jgi:hypothetical protein
MKRKTVIIGVAAVVTGILAACGHDNNSDQGSSTPTTPTMPSTPPPSTSVNVTTSELLTNYAEKPSETATPVPVNDGAFNITDTSEITTPISVNGS